jgi:hypothetical protein
VAGRVAERLELLVAVVQGGGRAQVQGRDVEGAQGVDDPVHVVAEHDEVGLVTGDGLGVGRERRQVGDRRVGGVVRGGVDGLDLRAGADREEHLGGRGRQRDDVLRLGVEGHLAVVAGDCDWPGRLLRGGGAGSGVAVGVGGAAAAGEDQRDGEQERDQGWSRGPGGAEHGEPPEEAADIAH